MLDRQLAKLPIKFWLLTISLLLIWFVSFSSAIVSAAEIWAGNEIFNHGFLIVPGSLFLIYRSLIKQKTLNFSPNYFLLIPIILALMVYQFGKVGDINVFMHIATFTCLPLMIWMCVGNSVANTIKFPLIFMLFSIPIGEQLIPHLQELTTNLAVPILNVFNVPVFRSGLYLEIPQGQFLVAEACSGISFFIGSLVFGSLYTYLTFRTLPNRILFIVISLTLPIIANAIRVFGIIYIAYLTDMEHAAGADHLIYGWFFYLIVLFILVMLGEFWRGRFEPKYQNKTSQPEQAQGLNNTVKPILLLTSVLLVSALILNQPQPKSPVKLPQALTNMIKEQNLPHWQPDFKSPDDVFTGKLKNSNIDVFLAAYSADNQQGELVSSLNRIYSDTRWTLVSSQAVVTDKPYTQLALAAKSGEQYYVRYCYQVGNKLFASSTKAKLYSTWLKLSSRDAQRLFIAIASKDKEDFAMHTFKLFNTKK